MISGQVFWNFVYRSQAGHLKNFLFLSLSLSLSLVGTNIEEICILNACTAASCGRQDLVNTWTALSLIATGTTKHETLLVEPSSEEPWAVHPFGRQLVQSL